MRACTRQPVGVAALTPEYLSKLVAFFPLTQHYGNRQLVNGAALSFAGSATVSPTEFGSGLRTTSSAMYASYVDVATSQAQTLVMTFRPTTVDANNRSIILKRNSSGLTPGVNEYQLAASSTQLQYAVWNAANEGCLVINSNFAPAVNRTYNIVLVEPENGGTGYMYVNGAFAGSATKTSERENASSIVQLMAQNAGTPGREGLGWISNVGIWSYAWPVQKAAIVSANPWSLFQEPQWLYTGMGSGSYTPIEVTG